MRTTNLISGVVAAVFLSLGCALREPTIELTASDFDLNPLVGKWSGEYSSEQTGRSGEIAFTLDAAQSEASGAVLMTPREVATNVVASDRPMVRGVVAGTPKQLITIHFVRKNGRSVIGLLDPYVDPDCACRVLTTFSGSFVTSRVIEGTYTTASSELVYTPTHGTWTVRLLRR